MRAPGSTGEHSAQETFGTTRRALAFYNKQMLDHLNARMRDFVARQEMVFVATADGRGECDCSFRAGPPGFVIVLDRSTLALPDYRGNGVMASLGNVLDNPHVGLMFIDFFQHTIGLHVNGRARLLDNAQMLRREGLPASVREAIESPSRARRPERWLLVHVEEAYIHCSKHIPLLAKLDKEIAWSTDDNAQKGGDFFAARNSDRPWHGVTSTRPETMRVRQRRWRRELSSRAGRIAHAVRAALAEALDFDVS